MEDFEFIYKGKMWTKMSTAESIEAMVNFTVRKDDVLVYTYPKSGTHWMFEIVNLIIYNGDADKIPRKLDLPIESVAFDDSKEIMFADRSRKTPYTKLLESQTSPRVMLTHSHLFAVPKQAWDQEIPIIYVARNPKDVIVSIHNFLKKEHYLKMESIEEAMRIFQEGRYFADWYEHVLEAYACRGKKHFLFVTYEEMQKDLRSVIVKICTLLGKEPTDDLITAVISHSSTTNMTKSYKEASKVLGVDLTVVPGTTAEFIHKGVSGRWREFFSREQSEAFDKTYNEKMKDYKELSQRLDMC